MSAVTSRSCRALLVLVLAARSVGADPVPLLARALVARAVRRAWLTAGLADNVPRVMAGRARAAGWLPQLQIRMVRGLGVSASQVAASGDARSSTDDSLALDVRVHFSLDRLAFDPSEIALARFEHERAERRAVLAREVIELLATLEDARARLGATDLSPSDAARAHADFARARARLETLTDTSLESLARLR